MMKGVLAWVGTWGKYEYRICKINGATFQGGFFVAKEDKFWPGAVATTAAGCKHDCDRLMRRDHGRDGCAGMTWKRFKAVA